MRRAVGAFLLVGCLMAASGCSLPGQAFPGGPSPWLPGGAPGSVYAPDSSTILSPGEASSASPAEEGADRLRKKMSAVSLYPKGKCLLIEGFRYNAALMEVPSVLV